MLPAVFKATESGDQFSVRYLQEWAASYTIAVHPNLLPMLWEHLENVIELTSEIKTQLLITEYTQQILPAGFCFNNHCSSRSLP